MLGRAGKWLIAIAVLVLILDVGLYAWGGFSGTSIRTSAGKGTPRETYQWTGGRLLLDNPSYENNASCDITGSSPRHVVLPRQSRRRSAAQRVVEVGPGSGTLACWGEVSSVNIRTGFSAWLWKSANSGAGRTLGVLLFIVPLVAGILLVFRRPRPQ